MREEEKGRGEGYHHPSEFPQKVNVVDICCLAAQLILPLIAEMAPHFSFWKNTFHLCQAKWV